MSDLVGNPEDRFSYDAAHMGSKPKHPQEKHPTQICAGCDLLLNISLA